MRILVLFMFLGLLNMEWCFGQHRGIDHLKYKLSMANTDSVKVDRLNELAFSYINIDPQIAMDDVRLAHQLALDHDYHRGLLRSETVMGGIEWSLANYDKALALYFKVLEGEDQDEVLKAITKNNIGEIFKKIGDVDRAHEYLMSAHQELKNSLPQTMSFINLGELYFMCAKYDSAMHYFKQALVKNVEEADKKYLGYIYHGMSAVYLATNNMSEALHFGRKSLHILKEINELRGSSYSHLLMSKIFNRMEDYDSSLVHSTDGLKYAHQIKARDIEKELYKVRARTYEAKGDFDSAYYSHINYSRLKDSLFSQEKTGHIIKVQTAYENEILKKKNKESLRQRNAVIVLVLMLFIIAVAIARVFYKQKNIQLRINRLLQRKNRLIHLQTEHIHAQAEKVNRLNEELAGLNKNLENKVKSRTRILKNQNRLLAEYAYSNAHELRAPVASVIGLVDLLKRSQLSDQDKEVVEHLRKSTNNLERVVRTIRERLEENNDLIYD